MLDRARDAERNVQLRSDRLARAADLAFHRQPPVVADRTGRGDLGAHGAGQLLHQGEMVLRPDAPSYSNSPFGLTEIPRLFGFLERRLRLLPDRGFVD